MSSELFSSRIRLRHLHCFVAVAQEQNLGKAANKLKLTQPAISKTLAELEELTQSHLFERGRHGAMLTPQGEVFLTHAVKVLETLNLAGKAVRGNASPSVTTLYVGSLPTVAQEVLPRALGKLQERYPQTRIVVNTAVNTTLLSQLKAGELDVAIGRMADPAMMVGLSFELLFVEPLVLVTRPGHSLNRTTPSLEKVLNYPLIVSPPGTTPRHTLESFVQSRGLQLPEQRIETMSVSLARLMVQQFDYVWCVPAGAIRDDLDRGILRKLKLSTQGTEEPVGLLTRSDSQHSSLLAALLAAIREAAASLKN